LVAPPEAAAPAASATHVTAIVRTVRIGNPGYCCPIGAG
jgi:hypothetical protein